MDTPFTLLDEERPVTVPATIDRDRVRLAPAALRTATGWELKPEGLCRAERCIPVPQRAALVHDAGIDLAACADVLGRPLALDLAERAACLGASAADRGAQLRSLVAPDFTLPDLEGHPHRLSTYRGRKVLLVAYASW
jgi:hypothetical protein